MKKNLILLFLLSTLTGCVVTQLYYCYSVNAKNIGKKFITDVEITSTKGFWHETGYLSKDAMKGLGGPQSVPPNDIYTIIVERNDNTSKKQVIDLRNKIKQGYRGDIIFLINDHDQVCYELKSY